jgi:hypothetical protein
MLQTVLQTFHMYLFRPSLFHALESISLNIIVPYAESPLDFLHFLFLSGGQIMNLMRFEPGRVRECYRLGRQVGTS